MIDCAASDPDGEVEPRGLVPVLYAHDELLQGKQEHHVKDAEGLASGVSGMQERKYIEISGD